MTWSCRQRGATYKETHWQCHFSGLFVQACLSGIRILIRVVKENTAYGGRGRNSEDLVLISPGYQPDNILSKVLAL